jgi:H2-forming N5,N10-methylenetetrahydromethanopterin dehydrogenase-like enzyme
MFKIIAIDMINSPNTFKEGEWAVVPNTSARLWFQLQVDDSLGARRYIPAVGSTVAIEFQRARSLTASNPVQQTFSKNAIQNADDKSMFYIDLTTTDTQNIITGSVKVTFTESAKANVFIQNYFIVRKPTTPGN